jgi:PAP2 superfamily
LLPQFALVPMVLMVAGQLARLRLWMIAFGLALIATSAISVFTPAVAAFVYLDLTPQVYANIAYRVHARANARGPARRHSSIPSFHTTGALMFIWAFRSVPYVRGPAAALNISLILATPIDGAHYFIDLVGRATVAFASIAKLLAVPLCPRRRGSGSRRSSGSRHSCIRRRLGLTQPERMFWLWWKTLSGSYVVFTSTSRS